MITYRRLGAANRREVDGAADFSCVIYLWGGGKLTNICTPLDALTV
jgi:hypothetical protein